MEAQIQRLVAKLQEKVSTLPPQARYLVAIAGIPGSGKTTLATTLTHRLTALSIPTAYIPMDGYHLTRMQLSLLPNPAHAHARRGAAFTFDADALLSLIRSIRALPVPTPSNPLVPPLFAPSFDHARKDPVPDDIRVDPACRVVVFEGNYLALAKGVWAEIGAEMDEVWFVDVDREVAVRRLVERHVRSGVAGSMEEAEGRARGNDWDNGTEILGNLVRVGERVFSVEEEGWEERVVGEEDEVEELN